MNLGYTGVLTRGRRTNSTSLVTVALALQPYLSPYLALFGLICGLVWLYLWLCRLFCGLLGLFVVSFAILGPSLTLFGLLSCGLKACGRGASWAGKVQRWPVSCLDVASAGRGQKSATLSKKSKSATSVTKCVIQVKLPHNRFPIVEALLAPQGLDSFHCCEVLITPPTWARAKA